MDSFPFALYDAFSATPFGGSQAAVVTNASTIAPAQRHAIAREIGMPATAFVDDYGADWIAAQFISAVMELPMCGHGTICLLTHLLESGSIGLDDKREFELRLPAVTATVALSRRDDGLCRVMLDIAPPSFEPPPRHDELPGLLGLGGDALDRILPLEIARGDFVHLLVPLSGLEAIRAIRPDFGGMVEFCRARGIETIAVFCREVENAGNAIHVRDFCPAVGVAESAAAGTTNAALSTYLLRHGLLTPESGVITLNAEQGLELGRPSSIQSTITLHNGAIHRLQVGGVASKVMDGQIYLREQAHEKRHGP